MQCSPHYTFESATPSSACLGHQYFAHSEILFQQELDGPEEPGNQSSDRIGWRNKQILVVINEFFLNGSIKPFHVGIHFGVLRYLMVFVEPANFLIEVLHAFRAIVGKHGLKRIGKDLGNDPEESRASQ